MRDFAPYPWPPCSYTIFQLTNCIKYTEDDFMQFYIVGYALVIANCIQMSACVLLKFTLCNMCKSQTYSKRDNRSFGFSNVRASGSLNLLLSHQLRFRSCLLGPSAYARRLLVTLLFSEQCLLMNCQLNEI